MKMKLCSLKYTPNTAAAVEEKPSRMVFMPTVMTEPTDCMMMDGTPIL